MVAETNRRDRVKNNFFIRVWLLCLKVHGIITILIKIIDFLKGQTLEKDAVVK